MNKYILTIINKNVTLHIKRENVKERLKNLIISFIEFVTCTITHVTVHEYFHSLLLYTFTPLWEANIALLVTCYFTDYILHQSQTSAMNLNAFILIAIRQKYENTESLYSNHN